MNNDWVHRHREGSRHRPVSAFGTKSASSSRSPQSHPLFSKCRWRRRLRYGGKRIEPGQVRLPKLAMNYSIGWNKSPRFLGGKSWIHTPEERRLRTRLPILESGFGSWQLRIHVSFGNAGLFHVRQSGGPVDIICYEKLHSDVAPLNTLIKKYHVDLRFKSFGWFHVCPPKMLSLLVHSTRTLSRFIWPFDTFVVHTR